jgi:hypothetical protein
MSKQEAIQIIKQVCSVYKGTLQEHQAIQQAISVLEKEQCSTETNLTQQD